MTIPRLCRSALPSELSFCLSFVQNDVNGERSEQLTQWEKHELGERGGRIQHDGAKPSLRVKAYSAADVIEIANDAFDPVVLQATGHLRTALSQPAARPDHEIMSQGPQQHEEALRLKALLVALGDAQPALILAEAAFDAAATLI